MRKGRWARGASRVALLALVAQPNPTLSAGRASRANFYTLLDEAAAVVVARVEERTTDTSAGFALYRLSCSEVLAGELPTGAVVVQELVFPSDRPWLAERDERIDWFEPLV